MDHTRWQEQSRNIIRDQVVTTPLHLIEFNKNYQYSASNYRIKTVSD